MRLRMFAVGRVEIAEQDHRSVRPGQGSGRDYRGHEIGRRRLVYGAVSRLSRDDRAAQGERGLGGRSAAELGPAKQRGHHIPVGRSSGTVRRRRRVCVKRPVPPFPLTRRQ